MSSGGGGEVSRPADDSAPSGSQQKKQQAVVLHRKELRTERAVRTILEEDEYVEKLGAVIQRDFFPDLPRLHAQVEYLEAVGRNDVAKIRALQERYSTRRRTEQRTSPTHRNHSPDGFEPTGTTPLPGPSAAASKTTDHLPDAGESRLKAKRGKSKTTDDIEGWRLDRFLNKYTTEDNASFEELTELDRRREKVKNKWIYDAEKEHESKITHLPRLLGQDEQLMLPPPRPTSMDNWTYKARSNVLFHPEDAPLTDDELLKQQKMNQKEIILTSTRFKENPFSDVSKSRAMTRAASLHAAHEAGHFDVTGAANVAPSLLVTPSPMPGVGESPLMTWGEIEGTPFRLDAADMPMPTSGPVFKIPEIPVRDRLAQELSETVAKRYRDKRRIAADVAASKHTKTPRFGSARSSLDKLVTMSPAARRLATSKLGIRLGSSDKALKASYTPSPRRPSTGASSKTPTPRRETTPSADAASTSSSITDNLLNIGGASRPRAADYF